MGNAQTTDSQQTTTINTLAYVSLALAIAAVILLFTLTPFLAGIGGAVGAVAFVLGLGSGHLPNARVGVAGGILGGLVVLGMIVMLIIQ